MPRLPQSIILMLYMVKVNNYGQVRTIIKIFTCLRFTSLTLSSLLWSVFDTYQKYQMRNAKAAFIKSALKINLGMELTKEIAKIKRYMPVLAVIAHIAVQQLPRIPKKRWSSNIVWSDKENQFILDARLHGQLIKDVAQTGPSYDENNLRAVIRETSTSQPTTDSIYKESGLISGNQSSKDKQYKDFWRV